ncbi:hypothetical protein ACJX0J_028189 [Zea mays]
MAKNILQKHPRDGIQIEIKKLQTLDLAIVYFYFKVNNLNIDGIQIEIKKLHTLELLSCLAIIKNIKNSRVAPQINSAYALLQKELKWKRKNTTNCLFNLKEDPF